MSGLKKKNHVSNSRKEKRIKNERRNINDFNKGTINNYVETTTNIVLS